MHDPMSENECMGFWSRQGLWFLPTGQLQTKNSRDQPEAKQEPTSLMELRPGSQRQQELLRWLGIDCSVEIKEFTEGYPVGGNQRTDMWEGTDLPSPSDDREVSLTLQSPRQPLVYPLSHGLWLAFWLGHSSDGELEGPLTKFPFKNFGKPSYPNCSCAVAHT